MVPLCNGSSTDGGKVTERASDFNALHKGCREEGEICQWISHVLYPLSPTKVALRVKHSSSTLDGRRALEETWRQFLSRLPYRLPWHFNLLALIEHISWHWILREFRGFRLPRVVWNLYCWIIVRGGALSWISWSRDVESPHNCFYLSIKLHDFLIVHVQPALR